MWLCTGKGKERPLTIVRRALDLQKEKQGGVTSREEEIAWVRLHGSILFISLLIHLQFLSLRKTLEANMNLAHLYPPGRILWALNDQDLQAPFRTSNNSDDNKVRMFEVLEVDKVFNQILFSRRMLG
jgi:hypothetical protein